jgi:acyl dehydratase
LADLAAEEGNEIGVSDWVVVQQDRIDKFADATGDHQWIHVDPERTRAELGMSTIAHGYLTLSLVPKFVGEILTVTSVKRALNYGSNKVRFTNMVPVGSRLRGRLLLEKAVLGERTLRTISKVTVDIEGEERPALVAETITLFEE